MGTGHRAPAGSAVAQSGETRSGRLRDAAGGGAHREAFRAYLRSRWGRRSRVLGAYAIAGNVVFFVFDWLLTRRLPAPPPLLAIAALRLPWVALPVVGSAIVVRAPGWRGLPAVVIAFSVAYTWGNDWAYYALGMDGSAVQALALVICVITAATFLPLAFRGRVGVLALQALGHLALEVFWPQEHPMAERLWTQVAILCLVLCVTYVFENFTRSQYRGLRLRVELERTVHDLEESKRRTGEAASSLRQLAARVSHEVNNPLAAVKVNVGYLMGAENRDERREVGQETLDAVSRIAAIIATLRHLAVSTDDVAESNDEGSGEP